MSYYSTLEVLALCDVLDKVPTIRQSPEEQQSQQESKKRSRTSSSSSIILSNYESKIPKLSKPEPQHDFLELDSILKDKKQHPQPKAYNDDLMRHQILSSSEAANSIQRRTSNLLNQSSYIQSTTSSLASHNYNHDSGYNNYGNQSQLQQQARLIQNKKAIQHQHLQNSSNRLPSLSTPTALHRPINSPQIQSPQLQQQIPQSQAQPLPQPQPQQLQNSLPQTAMRQQFVVSTPSTINTPRTPILQPTPKVASSSYNNGAPGTPNRSRSITPTTTTHTPRIPHNAGTTSSDDGTSEECEYCKRIFRGPKSSTHKQQHIKRLHPDAYVRKKGGVRSKSTMMSAYPATRNDTVKS